MGFSMEMLVLRPEMWVPNEDKLARAVVWWPTSLITGYASWGNAERGYMPKGQELAELCTTSWLYQCLITKWVKKPTRREFAPLFANPEDLREGENFFFRSTVGWIEARGHQLKHGEQVVMPLWDAGDKEIGFPSHHARTAHNAVLAMSRRTYARWRVRVVYDPMHSAPFVWVHCSQVAHWLHQLEGDGDSMSQRFLRKDKVATALVRSKRTYLHELGKIGCRVLFSFQGRISLEGQRFF